MGRRALLLLASILVAAAGTAMIWVYVQNADSRAQQGEQTVPVLKASSGIDIGTTGSAIEAGALATVVPVPRRLVPANAFTSLAQLLGRSATTLIVAGEFLVPEQFEAIGSANGVANGKVAVDVTVADPNRVAALLHPGMDVAVYYLVPPGASDPRAKKGSVRVLLPTVTVIGVGNTTVVRNAKGLPAQIGTQGGVAAAVVTLELDPADAPKVIMASTTGTLWFAALGDKAKVDPGQSLTTDDLPVGKG